MGAKQSIVKASDDGDCASLHSLSSLEDVPDLDVLLEQLKNGDRSYYDNAIQSLPAG